MSSSPALPDDDPPSYERQAAPTVVLVPSDWEDEDETGDDDDDMDYQPAEEDQFEGLRTLWSEADGEALMRMADASENLSGVEIEFDLMGDEDDDDEDDDDDDDEDNETEVGGGGAREGRPVFGELLSSSLGRRCGAVADISIQLLEIRLCDYWAAVDCVDCSILMAQDNTTRLKHRKRRMKRKWNLSRCPARQAESS
jgi:hypothetical protein